jgi:hypothetical protein
MEIAPPFCFVCEEGELKAQSWRFFEKQITKVLKIEKIDFIPIN